MKFTKLSLAALAAIGLATSASAAIENVKVDGDVKLWYQTTDKKADGTADNKNDGLFKKDGATGDLAATLRVTGDLTKRAGFGLTMNAITTLGLENHVVSAENAGSTSNTNYTNGTDANPMWFSEMYMTYKAGKTLAKIGRQELDTPLCYTETWGSAKNTFEAGVLVNQNIPDTVLVGAMVSRSNGTILDGTGGGYGHHTGAADFRGFFHGATSTGSVGGVVTGNTTDNGAYALGVVNSSVPGLGLSAFYYDVTRVGKAYWLEAAYDVMKVVKVEGLYTSLAADKGTFYSTSTGALADATGIKDTTKAYALKVSGKVANLVTLGAAYSSVSKGVLNVWNFATYTNGTPTSKLYTAGVGGSSTGAIAGMSDSTGWKVDASMKVAGIDLGAYYNTFKVKANDVASGKQFSPSSYALTVGGNIEDVNLTLAYINETHTDVLTQSTTFHNIRATDNNEKYQIIRAVATLKF